MRIFNFVPCQRMSKDYFYKRAFNQGISHAFSDLKRKQERTQNNFTDKKDK